MQMDADADAACCCIGVLIMMESGDGFTSGNLNGVPGAKRPLARVGKLAASSDCFIAAETQTQGTQRELDTQHCEALVAQHRHTPDKRGSVLFGPDWTTSRWLGILLGTLI